MTGSPTAFTSASARATRALSKGRKGIPNKSTVSMITAIDGALAAINPVAELVKLATSDDSRDRAIFWGLAGKRIPQHITAEVSVTLEDLVAACGRVTAERLTA